MSIVGIQASPSLPSRSAALLALATERLDPAGDGSHVLAVRALPAQALVHAEFGHPQIKSALARVHAARVVVIATPIYKAAYSGLLKSFLDLLPQDGLHGKTVLPLATGGSIAHLLALDYALKPVLSALGARDILDPVFATDAQMPRRDDGGYDAAPEILQRVDAAARALASRLPRQASPAPLPAPLPLHDLRWSV